MPGFFIYGAADRPGAINSLRPFCVTLLCNNLAGLILQFNYCVFIANLKK